MKELFYSEKDKMLFFIAGYTDNSQVVVEHVKMLEENATKLAKVAKVPVKKVRTDFITKSTRYKMMRVFFIREYPKRQVPKDAFILDKKNDWDMWKWLTN